MPVFAKSNARIRLIFTAAVLLPGNCVLGQITASAFKGHRIKATDPMAVTVSAALANGKALEPGFFAFVTAKTKKEEEQGKKKHEVMAKWIRDRLPKSPKFAFVDGVMIVQAGLGSGPVFCLMKGETTKHLSIFRLPAGKNKQAYLVYSFVTKSGDKMSLHFLMWEIKGSWKAVNISAYLREVHGMDFEKAFAAATKQYKAKDYVLAAALSHMATTLSCMPPYRVSGQQRRLQALRAALVEKLGLRQKRPVDALTTKYGRIDIVFVGTFLFDDGAYISIAYKAARDKDIATTEAREKHIATMFVKKHPDAKRYFSKISVVTDYTNPTAGKKGHSSTYSLAKLTQEMSKLRMSSTQRAASHPK